MASCVQKKDLQMVAEVVRRYGSGAKTSDVIAALVASSSMSQAKARMAIMVALDKGTLRTDSNFLLHAPFSEVGNG